MVRIALLVLGSTIFSTTLMGQSFYDWKINRFAQVSLGVGSSTYYGDLYNNKLFNFSLSSLHFCYKQTVINRLKARAEFTVFWIDGADDEGDNDERGLSFTSTNLEFTVMAEYSLHPTNVLYYTRNWYNPYAILGLGFTYFNPKESVDGKKEPLQPQQREGVSYSRIAPVIPMGAGIRFKINYLMNIALEGAYRLTFTDYLDDVSKRGNPDKNDAYFIVNIKVEAFLPQDLFSKKGNGPKIKTFRKFKDTLWQD